MNRSRAFRRLLLVGALGVRRGRIGSLALATTSAPSVIVACAKKSGGDLRLVEKPSAVAQRTGRYLERDRRNSGLSDREELAGAAGPAGNDPHRPGVHNGVIDSLFSTADEGQSGDIRRPECVGLLERRAEESSWNIRGREAWRAYQARQVRGAPRGQ